MSFFNPFRKNQRPEGVKLATMQTPEEAGTAAPHAEPTFGPRTEPSLGRFNEERRRAGRRHRPLSRRNLRPLTLLNLRLRPLGSKVLLLKRLSRRNAKPQRRLRLKQPLGSVWYSCADDG